MEVNSVDFVLYTKIHSFEKLKHDRSLVTDGQTSQSSYPP